MTATTAGGAAALSRARVFAGRDVITLSHGMHRAGQDRGRTATSRPSRDPRQGDLQSSDTPHLEHIRGGWTPTDAANRVNVTAATGSRRELPAAPIYCAGANASWSTGIPPCGVAARGRWRQ